MRWIGLIEVLPRSIDTLCVFGYFQIVYLITIEKVEFSIYQKVFYDCILKDTEYVQSQDNIARLFFSNLMLDVIVNIVIQTYFNKSIVFNMVEQIDLKGKST